MSERVPSNIVKRNLRKLVNSILVFLPSFIAKQSNSISIEGGLGSQILTYIQFRERHLSNAKVKCNLEYFDIPEGKKTKNLSYWKWELSSYGISRDSLSTYSKNFTKLQRVINESKQLPGYEFLASWSAETGKKYKAIFPVDLEKTNEIREKILGGRSEGYLVVHIRRGDYLYVASHLVTIQTYLRFIMQNRNELPNKIVFSSDSEFSHDDKEIISNALNDFSIYFLDNDTYTGKEIHDFMRLASHLICANSTFSFSAGLLASESSKVYFPVQFQKSGENGGCNPFLAVSDFALMRPF
jgi:hypothetical protein